jgi:hypothetical protein
VTGKANVEFLPFRFRTWWCPLNCYENGLKFLIEDIGQCVFDDLASKASDKAEFCIPSRAGFLGSCQMRLSMAAMSAVILPK